MTYNVFGGTLSFTQSINQQTQVDIGSKNRDTVLALVACSCFTA